MLFCFKQNTAYEMRISDWSSDVCSSDLNPMLKFVETGQSYPEKRTADDRAADFNEITHSFALTKAKEQSSRCSQCGVPYCSTHCPLHNHIPDWLRLTAEGRLREIGRASCRERGCQFV